MMEKRVIAVIVKDRNFSSKISAFPNKSRRKRGNISVLDYSNFLFVFAFLILFIFSMGFVSASVSFGNLSHSFEKNYVKGGLLKGWINVSFNQESFTSLVKAFDKNITLQEFLNKNSIDCRFSSKCSCYPSDCAESHTTLGNALSSKSFDMATLNSKIIGVKLVGNISHILDFSFNVSTNAGASCIHPLIIDLLADGYPEYTAITTTNDVCFIAKPYGCFEANAVAGNVNIGTSPLCGKITLPQAHGFRIGARLFGTGQTEFRMSLDAGGFQKTCSFSTNGGGEKYCTVILDDSIESNTQGTVCISSQQQTNYKINFEDNATCGFTESFNHDFEIFAYPLQYASVSRAGFNKQTVSINLSSAIMNYIEERYGSCNPECVIPIKFYSGINQQISLFNVNLSYKIDGLEKNPVLTFYEVEKKTPSISSEFLKLDLEKASFPVPSTYGEKIFSLNVGSSSITENISVKNIPVIQDIIPRTAPLLVPTDFIVVLDNYSSNMSYTFLWNFGNNTPIVSTSEPRVQYTFTKIGNYSVSVSVFTSAGNNTKRVSVYVSVLYESINETIQNYKKQLTVVEKGITSVPSWVQEKTSLSSSFNELKTSLARIESEYKETFRSEEEELIEIMNELTSLNVPHSFNSTIVVKPIDLIQSDEVYDSIVLEELGAGSVSDSVSKENYYEATNNWINDYLSVQFESSSFSYFYDEEEEQLFSHVKMTLRPKQDIEELYVVVNGEIDKIDFREDYGEKEIVNGYGIHFSELTPDSVKVIEFIYPEAIDVSRLPVYVSPRFDKLDFGAQPGVCNYNDICEEERGENYNNCRADCKPWTLTFLFFVILVVVVFVVYILLQEWYKRYYESYLFKNRNQLFNVMAFMNTAEHQHLSKIEIFKKLRERKWSAEQLNYAWNKLHGLRTGMWEIPVFRYFENKKLREELEKRKEGKVS